MNSSKCTLSISLNTIRENYLALCNQCPNSDVGAAVKADSYGLGARHITPILKRSGCKHFFVASCDEGIDLRKILGSNVNIYVLNGVFKDQVEFFLEYGLIPVLNHLSQIETWQWYASQLNRRLPCFIHIDTGMHRLGLPQTEIEALSLDIEAYKLDILCVMSHLSSAEDAKNPANRIQLDKFNALKSKFGEVRLSLANSSGIFLGQNYHFDLTRPGAAIYGINPTLHRQEETIKNPIKLFAPIIQIHNLPPSESVGYNETYTNMKDKSCPIATIPIGYADGFSRGFSNKGVVYINGYKAPIIGRVSMDLVTIDVSRIPSNNVFLGAQAEIIGDNCSPDEIAKICGTNSYEILTMLVNRYERIYN